MPRPNGKDTYQSWTNRHQRNVKVETSDCRVQAETLEIEYVVQPTVQRSSYPYIGISVFCRGLSENVPYLGGLPKYLLIRLIHREYVCTLN